MLKFIFDVIFGLLMIIIIGSLVWFLAIIFGAKWEYWETMRISLFLGIAFEIIARIVKAATKFDMTTSAGYRPPY